MNTSEKRQKLLDEVVVIAEHNYPRLFGAASVFLTIKELEIIKTVMEKK